MADKHSITIGVLKQIMHGLFIGDLENDLWPIYQDHMSKSCSFLLFIDVLFIVTVPCTHA
jgi:hypothetical protein